MLHNTKVPRDYECRTCKKIFVYEYAGYLPQYCPDHRTNEISKQKKKRAQATTEILTAQNKNNEMRMAIALSEMRTPTAAAQLAGFKLSASEAKILADKARKNFPDIIEQKPEWLGKKLYSCLALMLVEYQANIPLLEPAHLASSMVNLTKVMTAMMGETQTTPAQLTINVSSADPAEYAEKQREMRQLLGKVEAKVIDITGTHNGRAN